MIPMRAYDHLGRQIISAKTSGTTLSVDCEKIERDIVARIRAKKAMTVLVILWPLLAAMACLTCYILYRETYIFMEIAIATYIVGTYSLCWVGFPAGYRFMLDYRDSVTLADYAVAIIVGMITMCFSYFIAIVKIFKTKNDLRYIQGILLEARELAQ